MRGKKKREAVLESLQKAWRGGDVREQTRRECGLKDGEIEAALGEAESGAELARYAQIMVRESLLGVVAGLIERGKKETQAAKQFLELAQTARLLEAPVVGGDVKSEWTQLERNILAGLREMLMDGENAGANVTFPE